MLLAQHPDIRVSKLTFGSEGAPLLVIDNLVADPERLVRKAARSQFVSQGSMFPGIRAPAPVSYQQFLETTLNPLLAECFGLRPGRFTFPMCFPLSRLPRKGWPSARVPHWISARGGLRACTTVPRRLWCTASIGTGAAVSKSDVERRTPIQLLGHERRVHRQPGYTARTRLVRGIAKVEACYHMVVSSATRFIPKHRQRQCHRPIL